MARSGCRASCVVACLHGVFLKTAAVAGMSLGVAGCGSKVDAGVNCTGGAVFYVDHCREMCNTTADCVHGEVCNNEGICIPPGLRPPCSSDSNCVLGAVCYPDGCAQPCNQDLDCPTVVEACVDGVCTGVADPQCFDDSDCTSSSGCLLGGCRAGTCRTTPGIAGATCDDGDRCSTNDRCDGAGRCSGSPVLCMTPPPSECINDDATYRTYASSGVCTASTGQCAYPPIEVPCSECAVTCLSQCQSVSCLPIDSCHAAVCLGGMPPVCVSQPVMDEAACELIDGSYGVCLNATCIECLVDEDCAVSTAGHPECFVASCASGTCVRTPQPSAVCEPATCAGGYVSPVRVCGGDGSCPAVAGASCGGYACSPVGSACLTRCNAVNGCVAGYSCEGGRCVAGSLLADGETCTGLGNAACQSGYCDGRLCCASGACCNTAAECPAAMTQPAACDDAGSSTTCQGSRLSASCQAHVCSSAASDDDSACAGSSHACASHLAPIECLSAANQAPPQCPAACVDDTDCEVGYQDCQAGVCVLVQSVGCTGDTATVFSPDGSNTCVFSWSPAAALEAIVGSATNGGSISGTCQADGSWSYTFSCPNLTGVTCAGGGTTVTSPDASKTCVFTWGQASALDSIVGSGTNGGTISGTCQADGSWSYNFLCPNATGATCAGGGTTITSPDGSKTCAFSWSPATALESIEGTGSNGGTITGTCLADGTWSFGYVCPNATGATCGGGATTVPSPDQSNTCAFTWNQATALAPLVGSATNGGTLSGTCLTDGSWSYGFVCPNVTGVTCAGGGTTVTSPDSSKTCVFSWSPATAFSSIVGSGTNGGTLSGTCQADGSWSYNFLCPNATGVTCAGGGTTVTSPDGSNACVFTWGPATALAPLAGSGTSGGALSGTCQANGTWSFSFVCPNATGLTCAGGSTPVTSPDSSNTCVFTWGPATALAALAGSGTNGGTLSGTCQANGTWSFNFLCPNATTATCAGGSTSVASPDSSNTCAFTWSQATAGDSISGSGTNGGTISGTCLSNGTWSFSYVCPNAVTVTCGGGSTSVPSPDSSNTCVFTWAQGSEGDPLSASGTNGGTASGTCQHSGSWSFNYVCPNAVTVTCAGGSTSVPSPDSSNTCVFTWAQGSEGDPLSASGTNGGTATGTCQHSGTWSFNYVCPNAVTVTCAGGSTSVNSPDSSNTCVFTWSQGSQGDSLSGSGTNGGTLSGTCMSTGNWNYSFSCPNVATLSCSGGGGYLTSATNTPTNDCWCSWAQTTAPTSGYTASCDHGGTLVANCNAAGGWEVTTATCP